MIEDGYCVDEWDEAFLNFDYLIRPLVHDIILYCAIRSVNFGDQPQHHNHRQ